ncbi:hypothetical protein PFICI_11094 [Pestalotiopsis fici W106-1]|uniref:Zn(2)-C6 fungal-type domain-containing protein n=1 Tax=Pestalotiopsis fici (strain W106-1 / CGMCC3.15140) TaxID=1229662 RepID=W3WTQ4_PESFW|nr:uncharacterized protein PFICI_11094 [Pestalotiopsis fici W106-1]ETS77220.1 hypothetical protein PFICI_11094 [Pestalotiopsis fici W106-1]
MGDRSQDNNKRVRQACISCRRKKSRCSGERPTCSFCARLRQPCSYNDELHPVSSAHADSLQRQNTDLAARVAVLESKLSGLTAGANSSPSLFDFNTPVAITATAAGPISSPSQELFNNRSSPGDGNSSDGSFEFPSAETLQSLADVYFRYCHNRPYCYFEEHSFRAQLRDGSLPQYLLLAFAATAARFSDRTSCTGHQPGAMKHYAKIAWQQIITQSLDEDHSVNIHTVQAANMLGVLDYISGHSQTAWIKIGLAVRFAQILNLCHEVDHSGSHIELETRRRTFWSVYLLDRLVSCGRNRPPTLLDSDCTIKLPCKDEDFSGGRPSTSTTLDDVLDIPLEAPLEPSAPFALAIFMASVLGHVVRWTLQQKPDESRLPWDCRSTFSRIRGALLSFESYTEATESFEAFESALKQSLPDQDDVSSSATSCHFVFSHVLYHINQCLLYHPFLVRQRLKAHDTKIPPSFLREAIRNSHEHAVFLARILNRYLQRPSDTTPSFFGYAAVLAGGILHLHTLAAAASSLSSSSSGPWNSAELLAVCVRFLDQGPTSWESFRRMGSILKALSIPASSAQLLLSSTSKASNLEPKLEESLWQACDYNQMVTFTKPIQPIEETSEMELLTDEWPTSPGLMELLGRGFPPSDILTWSDWDPSSQALSSGLLHDIYQHAEAGIGETALSMDV